MKNPENSNRSSVNLTEEEGEHMVKPNLSQNNYIPDHKHVLQ